MDVFLQIPDIKGYDYFYTFDYDSEKDDLEECRETFNLNDEQYEKYLENVKTHRELIYSNKK